MSDTDTLTALVSGQPQSQEQVAAIVAALRRRDQLGQLAQLSGDPALQPFGQRVQQQDQQNEVELGRNAMSNARDDLTQQNITRQLNQGQAGLAETIRYHNMEDQERQDKLAQQRALQRQVSDSQSTIDKIGNYDMKLPPNRSQFNSALIDAVMQQYPNYDSTKFDDKQKAQKDFGTGPQGNMVRAAPVSIQHLDLADQKADLLHNSNFPAWNAIKNTMGPQLGMTDIAKGVAGLDTAKTIVGDEIDKFFINGGGAEKDRQALQSKLASATSPPAIHEVTGTLRQLMAGQMNGLKDQYETNVGGNFIKDKVKDPDTLRALGWDGSRFTGKPTPITPQPATSALPGAVAAAGGGPGMGSPPPPSAVPGGPGAAAQPSQPGMVTQGPDGSPITPYNPNGLLAGLRGQTGVNEVPGKTIVKKGVDKSTGKKVAMLSDGSVVPLE